MLDDILLPIFSILILLIIFTIIIIKITPDLFPSSSSLPCPRGYCKNNISGGIKLCPGDPNGSVNYIPGIEVCNPEQGCLISSDTPCTYWDPVVGTICPGDVNYTGVCPEGVNCSCTNQVYCPDFSQAYFEYAPVENAGFPGNPVFVQRSTWLSPSGEPRSDLPLSLGQFNQSSKFSCGLSFDNVKYAWPNGECVRGTLTYNYPNKLWYCMSPPLQCGSGQYPVRYSENDWTCSTFEVDPWTGK